METRVGFGRPGARSRDAAAAFSIDHFWGYSLQCAFFRQASGTDMTKGLAPLFGVISSRVTV